MKRVICLLCAVALCLRVYAQTQELQQLKLDLEKLAQFKLMLSQAKSGYQSMVNGYNGVIGEGKANFNLQKGKLDELLQVSAAVKNDPLVTRVNDNSVKILNDGRSLVMRIKQSAMFTVDELNELSRAVAEIGETVTADMQLLNTVLTGGKLRMSDAERSQVIGNIDQSISRQAVKLKTLDDEYNKILALRAQGKRDMNAVKKLGNLH